MDDIILGTIIFIAFCVSVSYFCFRQFKKAQLSKQAKEAKERRIGATMSAAVTHISGLPLARGLIVEMFYGSDKITFIKGSQEIIISKDKILDMDVVIHQGRRQKAPFKGATGRAISTLSSLKTHLVISYTSNGKPKRIQLDASSAGTFASKVQKDFRGSSRPRRITTEL